MSDTHTRAVEDAVQIEKLGTDTILIRLPFVKTGNGLMRMTDKQADALARDNYGGTIRTVAYTDQGYGTVLRYYTVKDTK